MSCDIAHELKRCKRCEAEITEDDDELCLYCEELLKENADAIMDYEYDNRCRHGYK